MVMEQTGDNREMHFLTQKIDVQHGNAASVMVTSLPQNVSCMHLLVITLMQY